ncbi:C-type lectin domain family 4 member M-like [Epinephelus fuscoguttatus]|uniref:C-type lectin domain family 4 member M-like n=1 Tax=Epinephelus fuscoguttatus TaxID=293821 RepID=UPI0020D0670E|nr:C-type lectin domain family 4 member M-like [Epinephelus fuscoguttatus]
MAVYENASEITVEMMNLSDASARTAASKSHSDEDGTTGPGGKLLRCVAVSFCLLCVLQVALNISLRLALSPPPGIDASFKNLTEERDELRSINLRTEENYKILTEERDELKRKLSNFASQQSSLTEERDELKRKLNDCASQQNSLTTERDSLKRKLNDFAHYSNQGWVYFSGSFYYISSIKETWQDSRNDCVRRGADLMIINSNEEQEFTRKYRQIMWIGLTDRETEEVWKWVDGTSLTTSFWHTGEPNNYEGTNEDCVAVNYHDYKNSWNDLECIIKNFWICEKKMTL